MSKPYRRRVRLTRRGFLTLLAQVKGPWYLIAPLGGIRRKNPIGGREECPIQALGGNTMSPGGGLGLNGNLHTAIMRSADGAVNNALRRELLFACGWPTYRAGDTLLEDQP